MVNGLDQSASKEVAQVDTSAVGFDAFIGGQAQGKFISQGFEGSVMEVIAFNRAIDQTERTNVVTYAAAHYTELIK